MPGTARIEPNGFAAVYDADFQPATLFTSPLSKPQGAGAAYHGVVPCDEDEGNDAGEFLRPVLEPLVASLDQWPLNRAS